MKQLLKSPLGLLVFVIALALVLPVLFMDRMFMDATMYTAVGNNLANGYGSPWFLYYSVDHTNNLPGFFENPPLGYWIFAVFFKVFGSNMYVERFYILITFLINILLITKLWKLMAPQYQKLSWLPVLFWSLTPVIFWTFTHNMMENTMSIFVLLAILFGIKAASRNRKVFIYAALSGLFIFLAFMTKGFPGMYPLATVGLYWLVFQKPNFFKAISLTLISIVFSVGVIVLLFLLPVSGESLGYYLFDRTFSRIGSGYTVNNRFQIVWDMVQQILVPLVLAVIVFVVAKIRKVEVTTKWKTVFFLFLLGLCGVLPLALTKVQRLFYLVPAIAPIAMAMALMVAKPLDLWQNKISNNTSRNMKIGALVLLTAVLGVTLFKAGKPKGDAILLADIDAITQLVGQHDTLITSAAISQEWGTKAYFMRRGFIQLDSRPLADTTLIMQEYMLLYKKTPLPVKGYKKVDAKFQIFDLYKQEI